MSRDDEPASIAAMHCAIVTPKAVRCCSIMCARETEWMPRRWKHQWGRQKRDEYGLEETQKTPKTLLISTSDALWAPYFF